MHIIEVCFTILDSEAKDMYQTEQSPFEKKIMNTLYYCLEEIQ